MTGAKARGTLEQRGQVGAFPVEGKRGQLPAHLADDAAGRMARTEPIAQVALGRLPRRGAFIPGAQGRKGRGVREAFRRGRVTGHFDESEFRTEMIVQG